MMSHMKRSLSALAIALLCLAPAMTFEKPSGFTFGAELRYAQTIDDMTEQRAAKYDVNLEFYPFMAEVGVLWDRPIPASFDTTVVLGARAGIAPIVDTESPDHDTSFAITTLPFGAFTRLEAGFLYIDAGVGAHRWDLTYDVAGTNLDNSGFGLSTSFSVGFRALLVRHLTLRTAGVVNYYAINDIGTGISANSLTVGMVCGVNFR